MPLYKRTDKIDSRIWLNAENNADRILRAAVDSLKAPEEEVEEWLELQGFPMHRHNSHIYFFDREEDAMLFYLRWGDQEQT